ncbi:MAG: hypothetical protein K8S20_13130 [Chloroflexi bacterium]|nr:hypothetical protein [Chloroflexota bacterium]
MNTRYPIVLSILIAIILSACGPAPEPTLTAEQIASTAVADAWMAVTQTAAAMPTATATSTPLPPTATPQPTFTFLPTLAPVNTTGGNPAAATAGPCDQPPPVLPLGTLVKVRFINKSGGSLNLSFGMNSPNDKKECVTYSYYLDRFDEPEVTVLAGCYWGWAWVTGKQPSVAKTGDSLICVTDPAKTITIWIESEAIFVH